MESKIKAHPLSSSDSDSDLPHINTEKDVVNNDRHGAKRSRRERIQFSKRFAGGVKIETGISDDLGDTLSLSVAEKKGLKEVEELERELDLKNTFSRETNKRDEDAEMNKYINEKMKERLGVDKNNQGDTSNNLMNPLDPSTMYSISSQGIGKIDDILLQSLSSHRSITHDEKSEAMLSSQMLNGIPEVPVDGPRLKSTYRSSKKKPR